MKKSVHTAEYAALRTELRAAREGAALSQRRLAARLKVPHSWVAKVENGERRIDLVEFCWFVSACGSDPQAVTERLLQLISTSRSARYGRGGRSK
jgi:transcriptional regulator with XRE-family HTH domain